MLTISASLALKQTTKPKLCLSVPEKWLPVTEIIPRTGPAKKPLEDAVGAFRAHVRALTEASRANVGLGGDYYKRRDEAERASRAERDAFARARAAVQRELASAAPSKDRVALLLGLELLRADATDEAANRLAVVPHDYLCAPNDPHGYTRPLDPDCEAAFAARTAGDPLTDYLFECVARRRVSASSTSVDALVRDAPPSVQPSIRGRLALAFIAGKRWDDAARELRAALAAPESKHPTRRELATLLLVVETMRGDDGGLAAVPDALPAALGSFVEPVVVDLWARQGVLPTGTSPGADAFRLYASRFEALRGRPRVAAELARAIAPDSWADRMLHAASRSSASGDAKERARAMIDHAEASGIDTIIESHVGEGTPSERILRSIGRACAARAERGPIQRTYTETTVEDPMGQCIRDGMRRTLPDVRYVLAISGTVSPLFE